MARPSTTITIPIAELVKESKIPWRLVPTNVIRQIRRQAEADGDRDLARRADVALTKALMNRKSN